MPQYFSDLTDGQWDRVRSVAFPDHPATEPLRRVVDGLLYRERARLPWALLPDDLPPAAELERHARLWADGTWARIVTALPDPPAPAPNAAGMKSTGLRHTAAGTIRKLPGGRVLLGSARRLARVVKGPRHQPGPHDHLAQTFHEARVRFDADDFAAAADLFRRVLDHDPLNTEAWLYSGFAHLHLQKPEAARDAWLVLLSVTGLSAEFRGRAHAGLGEAYTRRGDLDRAIGHTHLGRLIERYGDHAPWDRAGRPEEADEFEALSVAAADVAELALKHAPHLFPAAMARREQVAADYRRWLAEVVPDTLFLSEEWVRAIGHISVVDYWVKYQRLGWLGKSRIVLHAPPQKTVIPDFLRYYDPLIRVVRDPSMVGATQHLAATLGPRVSTPIRVPGHAERLFLGNVGLIQEEWERQGRAPLFRLTDEDRAFGRAKLRDLGVPDGAWFVALHARAPGFYKEPTVSAQDHRNADITTYLPMIGEVVRRGGWVIRLGDATMPPLPPTPGAVDYALSRHKSPRMDVFLCAASRFFVGGPSGPTNLPTPFGVPVISTNWISHVHPVASRNDLFVPKLIRAADGRVLPFDEMLRPDVRARFLMATEIRAAGLTPIDNTPEDLAAVAAEMFDRLDGCAKYDAADEDRQRRYAAVARRHGLIAFARVGRDFLRRHEHLLPAEADVRKAG